MTLFPCLGAVVVLEKLKPLLLFVVLTQTDSWPNFPSQKGLLALLWGDQLFLPTPWPESCWVGSFQAFSSAFPVKPRLTLGVGGAMAQSPTWAWQTRPQAWKNLFGDPNQADLQPAEFLGQTAWPTCSAYEQSPWLGTITWVL